MNPLAEGWVFVPLPDGATVHLTDHECRHLWMTLRGFVTPHGLTTCDLCPSIEEKLRSVATDG